MLDLFYAAIAAQAFVVAWVCVRLARRWGPALGFVDRPGGRKIHACPTPRCGGIGIFAAFAATLAIDLIVAHIPEATPWAPAALRPYLGNIGFVSHKLWALFSGATLMFLTGLADDRFDLRPGLKLVLQILAAVPLVTAGVTIKAFLPYPWLPEILTVFWIVVVTNAFNFLDNMNGLSAGVAAIAALNFYLVSRAGEEYFMMAIFAALFGAVLGFLCYNFPRASVFMGDSGSLFLGYLTAGASAMVTYYRAGVPTQLPVVAPLVVLGVPLFDTASVLYLRWRAGAPLMQGDRNHFSHRLVALGFSPTQAVLFIWLVAGCVGLTGVLLRWLPWPGAILALVQVIGFFLIIYLLERTAQKNAPRA